MVVWRSTTEWNASRRRRRVRAEKKVSTAFNHRAQRDRSGAAGTPARDLRGEPEVRVSSEGPARVPVEPGYDPGVLVAGMAVKDHVHQIAGRHRHLDGAKEGDERLVAVPAIDGTAVDPVPKATGPALSGPVGQRPTTVPSSTLSAANRVVVPSGSARSPAGMSAEPTGRTWSSVIVPALPGLSGRLGCVRSMAWICWGGWPSHGISVPGWMSIGSCPWAFSNPARGHDPQPGSVATGLSLVSVLTKKASLQPVLIP